MSRRDKRIAELIGHEAASYIAREAGNQSMITVTRTVLSANAERATVFVTVFPLEQTGPALSFLLRIAHDFRTHLAKNTKFHPLPKIEFLLDDGELNRQRLDEISKKT